MSDEEYVRSVWDNVSYCSREETNSTCPPSVFIAPFSGGKWVADFCCKTRELAWSAAAEFTRERLEQIWRVEEEIELLDDEVEDTRNNIRETIAIFRRLLAREQDALAELKRGMK